MSRSVVISIHSAALGHATLRFFRSPAVTPDFPWHVPDDLLLCMGIATDMRRQFQCELNRTYQTRVRVVATKSGIATIAPHPAALMLIHAMVELRAATPEFERGYVSAATEALVALADELPAIAQFGFLAAAAHNSAVLNS